MTNLDIEDVHVVRLCLPYVWEMLRLTSLVMASLAVKPWRAQLSVCSETTNLHCPDMVQSITYPTVKASSPLLIQSIKV